jgi:hypothetical protein
MKQSQKYAIHLDNLRQNQNITVEEFCFDIVDPRTFRRYKTGEKTLTHLKVIEFCKKLKISPTDFYFSARESDNYDFQQVNSLYLLASARSYEEFKIKSSKINKKDIDDIQVHRYLDFCHCKVDYELGKSNEEETINKLKEIVDFPDCLKYNAFDFVSLVCIQLIAEIEVKFKKEDALNKLIDLLKNPNLIYTSSETNTILPSIYSNVSILLLRLKKFDIALKISHKGIEYSIKHSNFNGLAHLYYAFSNASLNLGKRPEAELNAILCLTTALSKKNFYEIEMFTRVLTNELGIDPIALFDKYKEKLYNNKKPNH